MRLVRIRLQQMANTPKSSIPDLTETELWIARTALKERHNRDIELQLADADVRISTADRELTFGPVLVWHSDDGCTSAIFKTGERDDRGQFFDKPYKQMDTGVPQYNELAECTVALLQAQADRFAEQRGDLPTR